MPKKIVAIHGGGPTAVINSSLYGAVAEAAAQGAQLYGSLGGAAGLLSGNLMRLDNLPQSRLDLLLQTPASAIGTSRDHLEPEDYAAMAAACKKYEISAVLFNGGNGSMDACGKLCDAAKGTGVNVIGIPKTIDNDIAVTDHCPGYGSAARYIASTVAEIAQDVRAMPIHVCVVEAMGRNAGWVTGAAALAKTDDGAVGPHLIYLPEAAFDEDAFLAEVEAHYKRLGSVVAVVSEGLKYANGEYVGGIVFENDRSKYYGDVSAKLAQTVTKRLGIKARNEKPGIAGRASIAYQSQTDRDEAVLAGREAVRAALAGESGVMIGFARIQGAAYAVRAIRIPIEQVMLTEREMPREFLARPGIGVTDQFVEWCRPLIGGALREHIWF